MESLAKSLPREQERVREVLGYYQEIGPAGALGAAFIELSLKAADRAVMSGDVAAMITAYKDLQSITG